MQPVHARKRLKVDLIHLSHDIKEEYEDRTWSLGTYAAFSKCGLSDSTKRTR